MTDRDLAINVAVPPGLIDRLALLHGLSQARGSE